MPAIDLTRLKLQTGKLALLFDQPDDFLNQLIEILEFYKNRTLRTNQVIQDTSIPSFNTPRPVMRQIEFDIGNLSDLNPRSGVILTSVLWQASYYETRQLSAFLLGTIPPVSAMSLLTNLPQWLYENRDMNINTALLTSSLSRLRRENPQTFLLLINEWLNSPGPKTQTWGLHAFIPLIKQLGYDDLPQIFDILKPAIEAISPSTQMDVRECILTLFTISPVETLHYLSEIITDPKNSHVTKVLLHLLRGFPPELQDHLRTILKTVSNSNLHQIH